MEVYYRNIIDFKRRKDKRVWREFKGLCNIERVYDYGYVTDNLPDFSEIWSWKNIFKNKMVVFSRMPRNFKNGISQIIDSKYIEIRQGGKWTSWKYN